MKTGINITGVQKHVQRENKNYANKDINHERSHLNYDLVNSEKINYTDEIEKKIENGYTGKRKIRTDAVKLIDGIITSDSEFFINKSDEEIHSFFKQTKSFLDYKFGENNAVYATVHLDEKTPHMHFGYVPLTEDGRLNANEILGNKKALSELQDEYNEFIRLCGHDLQRGVAKELSGANNEQMDVFKKKTDYQNQKIDDLELEIAKKQRELEKAEEKVEDMIDLADSIEMANRDVRERFEENRRVMKHEGLQISAIREKKKTLLGREEFTGNVIIKQQDYQKFKDYYERSKEMVRDDSVYKDSDTVKKLTRLYCDNLENKGELERAREEIMRLNELMLRKNRELEKEREEKREYKKAFEELVDSVKTLIPRAIEPILNHVAEKSMKLAQFIQKTFNKQHKAKRYDDFEM